MLKRSLVAMVAVMLTGATAQAGLSLFGSIPCLTESCGDSCADPGCCDTGCAD